MLIDPFIVVAQIINFLILVALLKHFLYQPITQAMEARSQRIERQLAGAAAKEKDAETEKQLYQQKQQQLKAQKQAWLEQAKQEVQQEQQRLTKQAQAQVDIVRSQWYQSFEQDRAKFAKALRDRLTQQVASTARKALSDLANVDLEAQIVETFGDRLQHLDSLPSEIITASYDDHLVTIRSAFTISDEQQQRLVTAIRAKIASDAQVQFETTDDFICGIELRYEGYKIAWNLEHYLTELEIETAKVLSENHNSVA